MVKRSTLKSKGHLTFFKKMFTFICKMKKRLSYCQINPGVYTVYFAEYPHPPGVGGKDFLINGGGDENINNTHELTIN